MKYAAAYGFLLLGVVRAREHLERGDTAQAAVYGLIGLVGLTATVGGMGLGLIFIAGD